MTDLYLLSAIVVMTVITAFIRLSPFIIFKEKVPNIITYLGSVLPQAIMMMLIVYCLRTVSLTSNGYGIKELISLIIIFILHKWKHNTLLSIITGTVFYMLVQ